MQYDLLIKNGYVVDYASAREGYFDVAVQNGMIAAVESSIGGSAVRELDASGKLVLPGLVDSHVHASAWLGGSYAHTMLVKAGVTSALDMSGPGTSVLSWRVNMGPVSIWLRSNMCGRDIRSAVTILRQQSCSS